MYVPTNPNHHLIESSFSSSNSTKASGSGLSCGLSGHSSSSQNTCKRDRINLKAPGGGSASCSSCGSEENSLCRPSNTYNTKEQQQQKAWNTNGSLLEPVVIQQEVRNPKLKKKSTGCPNKFWQKISQNHYGEKNRESLFTFCLSSTYTSPFNLTIFFLTKKFQLRCIYPKLVGTPSIYYTNSMFGIFL